MKKKNSYLMAMIFLLILITACGSKNTANENLNKELEKINNLTYSEVEKELTKSIKEFMNENPHYTAVNIGFSQDDLAVDSQYELKKFNNIEMKIGIEVDSNEAPVKINPNMEFSKMSKLFEEAMLDMNQELLEVLSEENPIEYAKIGQISIKNKDSKYKLEYDFKMENLSDEQTMTYLRNEESEEEKESLEKVFEFIKGSKEKHELRRFGVEEKILIIEFDLDGSVNGDSVRELAKMSNGLHNLSVKDSSLQEYISNNKVRSMKIIFDRQEDNVDPIIYEYEVK